jgi:hypothetical protein
LFCNFLKGSGKPKTTNIAGLVYYNAQQTGVTSIIQSTSVDLDKLWWSVGIAESSNHTGHPCGDSWHADTNNCVSILYHRKLVYFASIQANKDYFKSLWVRAYGGGLPTLAEAARYTGNDKAYGWRATVISTYKKLTQ